MLKINKKVQIIKDLFVENKQKSADYKGFIAYKPLFTSILCALMSR
jgi:hypothetical protein